MLQFPTIGIDFGCSSLKLIEFTGGKRKKLNRVGMQVLPQEAIVSGIINDDDAVSKALESLIKRLGITTFGRRVALAIGGTSLIIKKFEVEATISEADLADQAEYEAQQHFQEDYDNTQSAYYRLPNLIEGSPNSQVLLVGAKLNIIDQYINIIHRSKLKVGVIDCDAFCLANMFEYTYGLNEGLTVLANIGASFTQVILIARGVYLYNRDISIGSNEYTRQIAEALGKDRLSADEIKLGCVLDPQSNPISPDTQRIFSEINDQLVSEIKTTVDYYLQSGEAPPSLSTVDQVFLAGGGAKTLGLDVAIAAVLQVPVRIADPFYNIETTGKPKGDGNMLQRFPTSYGVAVGLALRHMNDNDN